MICKFIDRISRSHMYSIWSNKLMANYLPQNILIFRCINLFDIYDDILPRYENKL